MANKKKSKGGYKHVTTDQLIKMGAFLAQGKSTSFIADKIGVSQATVSNRREEAMEMYNAEGGEVTQKALNRSWQIIRKADDHTVKKLRKATAKQASDIASEHIKRVQLLSDDPTEIINANHKVENERTSLAEKAFENLFGKGEKASNEESGE